MRRFLGILCSALVLLHCGGGGQREAGREIEVTLVNMVPRSLSAETNQDSEPFLTVDPTGHQRMVATAFTPNPFGTASHTSPVYVSQDGGASWTLNMILPSYSSETGTNDVTIAAGGSPLQLFGAMQRLPGEMCDGVLGPYEIAQTSDFETEVMSSIKSGRCVDQPFTQAIRIDGEQRVYVAGNRVHAPDGKSASVDVSLDGGRSFKTVYIESRATKTGDLPSVRVHPAPDGTVYGAFFHQTKSYTDSGGNATGTGSDLVVVRDDHGGAGTAPFQALVDPSGGVSGRKVVEDIFIPWNEDKLGQARMASTLTIAADPVDTSKVFIAWADGMVKPSPYTLHVRRSLDRGVTWSNDLLQVPGATCIALAVAANGTVGFLYHQLVGEGKEDQRWEVHVRQSRDGFESDDHDTLLATVPAWTPKKTFGPYLGDYNFMLSVGDEFRGVFSANNTPAEANFPQGVTYRRRADFARQTLLDSEGNEVDVSIDPFFFRIAVLGAGG